MDMRMPETRWAVFKRQVIILRSCCIWLVDSVESMMMHGLANPESYFSRTTGCLYLLQYLQEAIHTRRHRYEASTCGYCGKESYMWECACNASNYLSEHTVRLRGAIWPWDLDQRDWVKTMVGLRMNGQFGIMDNTGQPSGWLNNRRKARLTFRCNTNTVRMSVVTSLSKMAHRCMWSCRLDDGSEMKLWSLYSFSIPNSNNWVYLI
jgi:hypothetical protein